MQSLRRIDEEANRPEEFRQEQQSGVGWDFVVAAAPGSCTRRIGYWQTCLSAKSQMAVQREEHARRDGAAFRRHAIHARNDSAYEQDIAVARIRR